MMDNYFLKGIFIGIMFGVPVGVVGIMTIQRTLTKGFIAGIVSGLGSSLADAVYASISVFGLTLISNFLLQYQEIICILGCIFIVYIGISILKKEASSTHQYTMETTIFASFLSSFMITLTNPATILSFMVIFSTFQVSGNALLIDKMLLVLGIFMGTGTWWVVLSALVKWSKERFSKTLHKHVNTFFGTAIIILGIVIAGYSLLA